MQHDLDYAPDTPANVEPEAILNFLDEIRESNLINMYGAGPNLIAEFNLSKEQAKRWVLFYIQ